MAREFNTTDIRRGVLVPNFLPMESHRKGKITLFRGMKPCYYFFIINMITLLYAFKKMLMPFIAMSLVLCCKFRLFHLLSSSENSIHRQINDIVAIGVGSRTDSLTLQQIATDRTHVITENDADNLIYHQAEVVKLLCS